MKKLLTLAVLLVMALPAQAQITIPNTFSPNTVAQSALVNANFSQLGSLALNRAGGNLTGNLTADGGVTIDGVDIGATICTTCDPTLDDVTVDTLVVSSTAATAIDVAGGITAGTGNVAVIGTDGRIPAISSTYFASLSGANLTSIPETAITDGSLLARVGSAETISGSWTFAAQTAINNNIALVTKNNVGTTVNLANIDNSNNYNFGSANAGQVNNTTLAAGSAIDFQTNGNSRGNFDSAGSFNLLGAFTLSSTISPAALSAGNNNDYNPSGLSNAYLVRLTGSGGGSTLTGLAGGSPGRRLVLCAITTTTVTLTDEDTNSTAANRFADLSGIVFQLGTGSGSIPCVDVIYDGTSSRWRIIGRGI